MGTLVVGLTGGIASGKTTVSGLLGGVGAYIIDADSVGHRLLAEGGAGVGPVLGAFGEGILGEGGVIDRRLLGGVVFGAPEKLSILNGIMQPLMADLMGAEIWRVRGDVGAPGLIVLDAAILFEAGWDKLCDEVWVVVAEPDVARGWLMARNGLSEAEAQARLDAQISNAERVARGARVIENNGSEEDLVRLVSGIWSEVAG